MQWHQERQRLLAENVANADTPRFQPRDLTPPQFERTRPTHVSLGLARTSPAHITAASDAIALKIREVAEEHRIPVVQNPPLARALHGTVEIDREIPPEHYQAVAEVIGYVMRLNGRRQADDKVPLQRKRAG